MKLNRRGLIATIVYHILLLLDLLHIMILPFHLFRCQHFHLDMPLYIFFCTLFFLNFLNLKTFFCFQPFLKPKIGYARSAGAIPMALDRVNEEHLLDDVEFE